MTTLRECDQAWKERFAGLQLVIPGRAEPVGVPVFIGEPSTKNQPSRPVPCLIVDIYDIEDDYPVFESGRDFDVASRDEEAGTVVMTAPPEPKEVTYSITGYANSSAMSRELMMEVERRVGQYGVLDTPEKCYTSRAGFRATNIGTDEVEWRGVWLVKVNVMMTYPAQSEVRFVAEEVVLTTGPVDGSSIDSTTVLASGPG